MPAFIQEQFSAGLQLMYGTSPTVNGFTALKPSAAEPDPTQGGILPLSGGDLGAGIAAAGAFLQFFGGNANGNTMSAQLWGWSLLRGQDNVAFDLWVPALLCSFSAITIDGTFPGVAGTLVGSGELFASQITLNVGNSALSVEVLSPGSTVAPAHVVVSCKGMRYLQMLLSTGGVANHCNGVWRPL
jgi:hypothetical protein